MVEDTILKVDNLNLKFKTVDGIAQVLNGVDLAISRGEKISVVGESGCGKSITAKCILGLQPPNAEISNSEILFKDEDILDMSDNELRRLRGNNICTIVQDPMSGLSPVFTVGEQMMDLLKYSNRNEISLRDYVRDKLSRDDNKHREKILAMLEQVEIPSPERVFESYPIQLSGGMRQRVLIAMSLLMEPDLLIADEPGTALDVTTERNILRLIKELIEDRDTALLYITHDLGVAKHISEEVYVMYAGEIVEKAPTETLFKSPQHPYTAGLIQSVPSLTEEMGEGIEGDLPDYTDPPKNCRFYDRCVFAEDVCNNIYPYPRKTGDEHITACHIYSGPPAYERFKELDKDHPCSVKPKNR